MNASKWKPHVLWPHTGLENRWDAFLLINTSRPREPVQWMWYGTPPACTHPLLHEGGRGPDVWGRGRENTAGDGGGDDMSCPIFSPFFPPLQHIHACMRVCVHVCAHCFIAHARGPCDQPWPPFYSFTNPGSEAESIMGAQLSRGTTSEPVSDSFKPGGSPLCIKYVQTWLPSYNIQSL